MPLSTVKRVVDIREAEGNVYISMFQMSWYIILPPSGVLKWINLISVQLLF